MGRSTPIESCFLGVLNAEVGEATFMLGGDGSSLDPAKSDDSCLLPLPQGSEEMARGEPGIVPLWSSCLRARGLLVEGLRLRLGLRGSFADWTPEIASGLLGDMPSGDW